MKFNNILKLYSVFYIIYMLITNTNIYNINIISITFYIMLVIKILVLFHNEMK